MPTPTRLWVALQTLKSARAGVAATAINSGTERKRKSDARAERVRGLPASSIPKPLFDDFCISGALFGNVRAHVNAWLRAYPIDLGALGRRDLLPHLAYSKKGWQNNGVSTYPHIRDGRETTPKPCRRTNCRR
ncbi:protein of unknown function [Aminobacter niigataensis]|nr:protein of unknown function [Aminobacter niigataensis]